MKQPRHATRSTATTPSSESDPSLIAGLRIAPVSLLTICLLEEIGSPILGGHHAGQSGASEVLMGIRDLALAIAIFTQPLKAAEIIDTGGANGLAAVAALTPFARSLTAAIPASELARLSVAIGEAAAAAFMPGNALQK